MSARDGVNKVLSGVAGASRAIGGWARRRPWLAGLAAMAIAGVYTLGVFGGGLLVGDWISDNNLSAFVRERLDRMRSSNVPGEQEVAWTPVYSNLHALEVAAVRAGPFESGGGGIAEIEGDIIFSSQFGRFGVLTAEGELAELEIEAPMNLEALLAHEMTEDPLFKISGFRVHDLLPRPAGDGVYDLYVTHQRFNAEQSCFEFVVDRAQLATGPEGLHAPSTAWEEIFVAEPCLRAKNADWLYVGEQSGGRMAFLDDDTLLVTIGDMAFDGFNDTDSLPQRDDAHFGKVMAVTLSTGEARIYAKGVRNPQGLLIDRDGRIWETEHGPQGGDEINLITEGANYGWPVATYGVNYGLPRRDWPFNDVQGSHDGYVRPEFAFMPGVGISNIVQPDPDVFPLWEDSFIVASLRAQSLFQVRMEDGDAVYAEPIELGHRLRDLITLSDGRLAAWTDDGYILLIRNGEDFAPTGGSRETFIVSGLDTITPVSELSGPRAFRSPLAQGRAIFTSRCASCHSLAGAPGPGPALNGVMGRQIGSVDGFGYSSALSDRDDAWTRDKMIDFILDPENHFSGTTMPQQVIPSEEVLNLMVFMEEA